jgi:hypothetical protein
MTTTQTLGVFLAVISAFGWGTLWGIALARSKKSHP